MKRRAASASAVFAACLLAHLSAHAQVRAVTPGVTAPPVVVPPIVTIQPPARLDPVAPPTVVVPPPSPAHVEASPDGGDSDCQCPGGQTADLDGWCWRRVEASAGYWQKAEKCQK